MKLFEKIPVEFLNATIPINDSEKAAGTIF